VKLVFQDLNSPPLAGRIWIVLWGRHVTKRIYTQRKKKQEEEERKERETMVDPWKNVFRSDVVFYVLRRF